jgi:hypothetical protein
MEEQITSLLRRFKVQQEPADEFYFSRFLNNFYLQIGEGPAPVDLQVTQYTTLWADGKIEGAVKADWCYVYAQLPTVHFTGNEHAELFQFQGIHIVITSATSLPFWGEAEIAIEIDIGIKLGFITTIIHLQHPIERKRIRKINPPWDIEISEFGRVFPGILQLPQLFIWVSCKGLQHQPLFPCRSPPFHLSTCSGNWCLWQAIHW